jgi:hypothetical protein
LENPQLFAHADGAGKLESLTIRMTPRPYQSHKFLFLGKWAAPAGIRPAEIRRAKYAVIPNLRDVVAS